MGYGALDVRDWIVVPTLGLLAWIALRVVLARTQSFSSMD